MAVSVGDFGSSFKAFMDQMAAQKPSEEPFFLRRLRDHFGQDPTTLPIVSEKFEKYEHPNVHVAIEDYLSQAGRSAETYGILGDEHKYFGGTSLSNLVAPAGSALMGRSPPKEGPIQYLNIPLEEGRVLACVQSGLFLVKDGNRPLAALLEATADFHPMAKLKVEVMAPVRAEGERFLSDLRLAIRKRNVYRGHILSLNLSDMHALEIQFHHLPDVARENIVLPEGLLERIERQTLHFGKHAEKLLAAGRHLKRGLLFHGAPGTGKTFTAMYLAGKISNRTVLLLTGRGLGLIEQSCALARTLQPSIVILEDVDLVAEERTHRPGCATPLLFELLNEMDGLADDSDILFLLTTNRPDLLEPALAARPGRIDQAFEIPLPDRACRRRLFDLYGKGLKLRVGSPDRFIHQTQGASAAFIRELMRKAALFAADEGGEITVEDRHLEEALHELAVQSGDLTKSLLGFQSARAPKD